MFAPIITAALFIAAVNAGCDNQCSGHGTCTLDGLCICYDNWGLGIGHLSGDCSERICPYDFAWADAPKLTYSPWLSATTGLHHQYAECSAQGVCNRDSGECECFPGYTGAACARMSCPNDCSGHGQCKSIETLPYAAVAADYSSTGSFMSQDPFTFTASYYDWDKSKSFGCVCDPAWGDYDCSKRTCEHGTDIMDHRLDMTATQKYQTQLISFYPPAGGVSLLPTTGTFALTFKSKLNETYTTEPIMLNLLPNGYGTSGFTDFLLDVRAALESLPNRVIDQVTVTGSTVLLNSPYTSSQGLSTAQYASLNLYISFTGSNVQGPQNLLTVKAYACSDGCTPKLSGLTLSAVLNSVTEVQSADYQSYECGRRGKCDYSTGICTCFSGYTGVACNTITALV